MKLKLFTLVFSKDKNCFDDTVMRTFLADKEVSTVYSNPLQKGDELYWAILVKYSEKSNGSGANAKPCDQTPAQGASPVNKVEAHSAPSPLPELTPGQLKLYEAMRKWRFDLAKKSGIPAYQICTNKELALIIKTNPLDTASLSAISGIKKTIVNQYGLEIIRALVNCADH